MAKQKITNKKSVLIDAKTETIANDITNWQKEFAPFVAADINKQAYQASYIEAKSSNGITYTLKDSEDLPLKLLIITMDSLRNEPKKIEANIVVHNYLYNSEKYLVMALSNGDVSEYNIESNLKLFLGDKKTFRISGKLSYEK